MAFDAQSRRRAMRSTSSSTACSALVDKAGWRKCRTCHNERQRSKYRARKEVAAAC